MSKISFHVERKHYADQDELVNFNGNRVAHWSAPPAGRSVLEQHVYPNPAALKGIADDDNELLPPPHWHWYQEEYFIIKRGRFIFTVEGKKISYTADDPQPMTIPVGKRHRFKPDPTSEEPCELQIMTTVSPLVDDKTAEAEAGLSERFFRNVYCYIEDCSTQKVKPSLPQLLLFLHSAEISLAFPGPGWLARPLSYLFGLVVGKVVGQFILGYKDSYPEYYDPSRRSKKQN